MSTPIVCKRTNSWLPGVLLLAFTMLIASCGGAGAPLSAGEPAPNGSADARLLPLGSPLPSLPVEHGGLTGARATSAVLEYSGSVFLNAAGGTIDGETLILQSSEAEPAWAMYRADGLTGLKVDAFGVETIPGDFETEYSVGISNFSDGRWSFMINSTLPEVEIDLADNTKRLVSRLGNLYWLVVVSGGKSVRVVAGHVFTIEGGEGDWRPECGGGIFASKGLEDRITVEWAVREGAASYELYRKVDGRRSASKNDDGDEGDDDGGQDWVLVVATAETTYHDFQVQPSVWHKYKVRAVNEAGPGGFSEEARGYMGAAPQGDGDDDECESEGLIVDLTADLIELDTQLSFMLTPNTQWFLADGTVAGPADFTQGDRVKVHGRMVDGACVAFKVKLKDDSNEPEYFDAESIIATRAEGTMTLQNGMSFQYSDNTIWKDAGGNLTSIDNFTPGVAVKVWGVVSGDGPAFLLKAMLQDGGGQEQYLVGEIASISDDILTLTDGSIFIYSANTLWRLLDGEYGSAADFVPGDPVKVHYVATPAGNFANKVKMMDNV